MGQLELAGRDALAAVQRITSNDASKLQVGQAQYSALTTPAGTFVDDVLVYRFARDHFLFVVNASNVAKDFEWVARAGAAVWRRRRGEHRARATRLLALQGPAAGGVLQALTDVDLDGIRYYWFAHGEVAGVRVTMSRTGYTGESGFEIFAPPQSATRVWEAILAAGRSAGVVPAGLGARDTLRLEAAMRLYGNDIDETTTVLEAGLEWIVGLGEGRVQRARRAG